MDMDKIKERIAKLLAMASDASSPNEAAIAAARARTLMDKHQLEEFDVAGANIKEEFGTVAAWEKFIVNYQNFQGYLAVAVANYNDCAARFEQGYTTVAGKSVIGRRIIFVGYKSDVDLAQQMYDRLYNAIWRMSKEWQKSIGEKYSHRLNRNYFVGAVAIVRTRLEQMTKERNELMMTSSGTSLMVIKKDAVAERFGETKYKTGRGVGPNDQMAAAALLRGRIDGAKVEIVRHVQ